MMGCGERSSGDCSGEPWDDDRQLDRAARNLAAEEDAAITIASLIIRLDAETSSFHRKMGEVAHRVETTGRQIARAGHEISMAISLPLIAAGAAAFAAALEESHRQFGPLYAAWSQLKAQVVDLFTAIGRALTPVFLQLIEAKKQTIQQIRNMVAAFQQLSPTVQRTIVNVLLFLAALGPTILIVGKLIAAVGAIGRALTLLTSPIGLTVLAIAALAAAAIYLITHWERVKLRMVLMWTAIKEAVFDAVDGVLGVLQTLTGWIPKLGDAVKDLRARFDAWADQSLARSAVRIQQLEGALRSGTQAVQAHGAVLEAVRNAIADYNESMRQLAVQTVAIGPRFNAFAAQAEALKRQLDDIVKAGPQAQAQFEAMVMPLDQLAQMWTKADDAARIYADGLQAVAAGYTTYAAALELANRVASGATSLRQAQAILQAQAQTVQDVMSAMQDSIAAFGESIANILDGTAHGFSGFARALEGVIGSVMEKIGKTLVMIGLTAIAYGVLGKAIQHFATNPLAAIAAGVALIALGHALSKSAQSISAQGLSGGGGDGGAAAPAPTAQEGQGSGKIVLELHGDSVISHIFQDPQNQDALAQAFRDLTGRNVIVEPVTV